MEYDDSLQCNHPRKMHVVFGNAAALAIAKPLIEEIASFSEGAALYNPSFSTTASFCRRALDEVFSDAEYELFLEAITRTVIMSLTRNLNEEERYFGGALFELERILEHPFTYEIQTS